MTHAVKLRLTVLALAAAVLAGEARALDPPPPCHDALWWGLWATSRISPKVVNQNDIATITATLVGGPPRGIGCAWSQWVLEGTSAITVNVPPCFELVDYEPKADANHLVLVDAAGVHWSAIWSAPPGSTVNDHCFCRSWGGGQWSETSTCPANLSAGAWGPGAVFKVTVKATCARSDNYWTKATLASFSGWWGLGWGYSAEDYFKFGGAEWVSLTADPTSAPADGTQVALTARVYEKNSGVNMPGQAVSFSSLFGILNPASASTDVNGLAQASLASPGGVDGPDVVMASIPGGSQDQTTVQFTHVDNPPVTADSQLGKLIAMQLVGEPVHAGLGNYIYSRKLFDFPGKGLSFAFEVNYNSLDHTYNGPLGAGWTHTYNAVLTRAAPPSTDVSIKWGDGHSDHFQDDGSGHFTLVNSNTPVTLSMPDPGHYLATLHNKNSYQFDSNGRLLAITDLNGNTIALAYSIAVPGQIDRITDTAGRQIAFTWDLAGRVTAITSPLKAGNTVAFQYDGLGNLTGITDPRGKTWGFTYDASHRLLTHVDARGVTVVTNTYDGSGRVGQQTDGSGHVTTYSYVVDGSGTTTTITPPSGHAVTHVYDLAYNLVRVIDGEGHEATFSSDGKGRITGVTDKNGHASSSLYDGTGNVLTVQDRTTAREQFSSNALNRPTSVTGPLGYATDSFEYDASGNLTAIHDANGGTTSLTVDSSGLSTMVRDSTGGQWSRSYDASGLPQTARDPTGVQVGLTHDAVGRLTQVTLPIGGATIQSTYDAAGNLLTRTDPLGHVTTFSYDANGNLATSTFVPTGATTTYEYDWAGRPVKVTNPLGGITTMAYDVDGNQVSTTDPDGLTLTRLFDRANRLTATVDPLGHHVTFGYDANGNVTSVRNEIGNTWSTTFDAEGRILEIADPLGSKRTTTYDLAGRVTGMTDPLGHTTAFQYDAANRLIATTLPDQGVTSYLNDGVGRPLYISDPLGHYWMLSYDGAGRLVSRRDPNGQIESYGYDGLGRLASKTQRDGTVVNFAYDVNGQLISASMPGQTVTYAYDAAGNLTSVTDPSGTTTMTYDILGRRLTRTDPNGKTVSFTYTTAGRIKTMTYPGSNVVTYAYDATGRLSTITDWRGNQTSFQYDAINRLTQATLPNGTRTLHAYDAAGRITSRVSQTSGGTVLASYIYGYDAAGRITSVQRSEPATSAFLDSTATYVYDPVNRILTATADGLATNYTFDLRGNLTAKTSGSVTTSYAYDTLNRLVSVSDGTNTTTYSYDGAGNRLGKTFNGAATKYVREGGDVYCTLDGSGNVQRYNIYAGSLLYSLDAGGAINVYHSDERGSIVAITDAGQSVVQSYSYDPYGKVLGSTGGLANAFQFVGAHGVMADENGLCQMQARYYDPDARRFVTEDPLGLSAGLNLYGYTGGDPVNRTDPGGLDWWLLPYLEFPNLGPGTNEALRDAEAYVRWATSQGQTDEQSIAMNAYGVYFGHFRPPKTPPSILNAGPALSPEEAEMNPVWGSVDPLAPMAKTRNWGTATNAKLEWMGPGGVPQSTSFGKSTAVVEVVSPGGLPQAPSSSPGFAQRTLTSWRTWVGGVAARIALQKTIIRATVSYAVEMALTDVGALTVGEMAAPVVISGAGGWLVGRGIGTAKIAYDPTRNAYISVDQGLQEMIEPYFERAYRPSDWTWSPSKGWVDQIRQHTEYLDGLLDKTKSW